MQQEEFRIINVSETDKLFYKDLMELELEILITGKSGANILQISTDVWEDWYTKAIEFVETGWIFPNEWN